MSNSLKVGGVRVLPNTDGSQTNSLDLASKSNAHAVKLKAPDTVSADVSYTLPGALGTAGEVLTDAAGTGVLSWAAGGGGGGGGGGVSVKTANYTAVSGDTGTLIVFNSGSAVTLTLPATPPSATWNIGVANIGVGELTCSPNSLDIDGATTSLLLCQSQGIYVYTDGTNYFSERGGPLAGSTIKGASGIYPVLTLIQTQGTGGGQALIAETTDTNNSSAAITASVAAAASIAVQASAVGGYGVFASISNGAYGGAAVIAEGADGWAVVAANDHPLKAAVFVTNSGGGPGGQFDTFLYSTGMTLAAINALTYMPQAGSFLYCTDAKNILDDGVAAGSVAVSGGHGAMIAFVNGSWRVMC